jgi:hypothetical protein
VSCGQCDLDICRWRQRPDHYYRVLVLSSSRSYRGTRVATGVSGSPRPRAGSDLPLRPLLSARGVIGGNYGVYVHHGDEVGTLRTMKAPFLACQMLKWFYDTSTSTA